MRLGELDDPGVPSVGPRSPLRAPRAYTPTPMGMGAVRASERELLHDGSPPIRRRSSPAFAAAAAAPRAAAATVRLPVPRAPSVPPASDEPLPHAGLDYEPGEPDPFTAQTSPPPSPFRQPTASGPPPSSDPATSSHRRELRIPESGASRSPGSAPRSPGPVPPRAPPVGLRLGGSPRRGTPHGRPAVAPPILAAVARAEPALPASEPAPNSLPGRVREMQELLDAHNYSNALVLAESVLATEPGHALARRCAERCREALAQKYLDRLGGREVVPRVTMSPDEVCGLALDHRAGFLLSLIDGATSVDEVLDGASMPALDALRMLYELREQGAIEVVEPPRRPGRR
jgi:hypothetical protein